MYTTHKYLNYPEHSHTYTYILWHSSHHHMWLYQCSNATHFMQKKHPDGSFKFVRFELLIASPSCLMEVSKNGIKESQGHLKVMVIKMANISSV